MGIIGLLHSITRIEEKEIMHCFRKRRIAFESVDPRSLALNGKAKSLMNYSVVLNREVSQTRAEQILEYLNGHGVRTINSAQSTRLCNNKALCTWKLQNAHIPVPRSIIAFSKTEAIRQAEIIGYPLVMKPLIGSWGRLMSKINDRDSLESVLEYKEALNNPLHAIYYLQEYIKKPGRDIRILLIGKEPVAAMYRQSEHWITNTAKGAIPKKLKLNDELIKLSHNVMDALQLDIGGIDIVEIPGGYQVFEANATVEFHGLQTVSKRNIADAVADYLVRLNPDR